MKKNNYNNGTSRLNNSGLVTITSSAAIDVDSIIKRLLDGTNSK